MKEQESLFGNLEQFESWRNEWKDMPEFQHGNEAPMRTIHVHFKTQEDIETFFKLIKQDFTDKTKFIWYPPIEKNVLKDKGYAEE